MEISKLTTFVDLAETLNFSKTAINLYITQSSVSKHIQALEKELGHSLFTRNRKEAVLTDYGRAILPYAQKMVADQDALLAASRSFERDQAGKVLVGTIPTAANYQIFTDTLTYLADHSDLSVSFQETESSELGKNLASGKIDFALARVFDKPKDTVNQIVVVKECFKVYLSRRHPLADRKQIKLTELANENFIMLAKESCLYDPVIALCRQVGFSPQIGFVSNRVSSIMTMVADDQGIAIMMTGSENHNTVAVDLLPTSPSWLVLLRRSGNLSPAGQELWDFWRNVKKS